jgi:hypothetical protein
VSIRERAESNATGVHSILLLRWSQFTINYKQYTTLRIIEMNAQTETNVFPLAAESTQTRREQLDQAMAQFALSAGTFTSIEMLAEERSESDVALLAAVGLNVIRDAHAACLDHVKDGSDIGLDDSLGLVDRALLASTSIFAAIRVLSGDWSGEVLDEHTNASA